MNADERRYKVIARLNAFTRKMNLLFRKNPYYSNANLCFPGKVLLAKESHVAGPHPKRTGTGPSIAAAGTHQGCRNGTPARLCRSAAFMPLHRYIVRMRVGRRSGINAARERAASIKTLILGLQLPSHVRADCFETWPCRQSDWCRGILQTAVCVWAICLGFLPDAVRSRNLDKTLDCERAPDSNMT
jgi:hypothetical protein